MISARSDKENWLHVHSHAIYKLEIQYKDLTVIVNIRHFLQSEKCKERQGCDVISINYKA